MRKPETGTRVCASCLRTVEIPDPQDGHPHGWYSLSVLVPRALSNGRGYRWVGMYCTPKCLADGIPAIEQMRAKFRGDIDYE